MKHKLWLIPFLLLVSNATAFGDAVGEANSGMAALGRHDYNGAVQFFTRAMQEGGLSAADRESAFVERATAYIGQNNNAAALADLAAAQKLNPKDGDIPGLRAKAQAAIASAAPPSKPQAPAPQPPARQVVAKAAPVSRPQVPAANTAPPISVGALPDTGAPTRAQTAAPPPPQPGASVPARPQVAALPPAPQSSPVLLEPIARTHTVPPYPALSQRMGEEGASELQVTISTRGAVTGCKVAQSSGSDRLDEAACTYVQAQWRWEPPTQDGKAVTASTMVKIVWNLKNAR